MVSVSAKVLTRQPAHEATSGWQEAVLGNILTLQRGFDLPYRLRRHGSVPIVTSSGIEDFHAMASVRAPGVVTGRYGTIGKVFYIEEDYWPLNTTLFVCEFKGNDPRFIYHFLKTIDFKSHSGKSGVPGVNRNDLHQIVVQFPRDRTEQTRIADALSDADALIESFGALVAKKRAIRQGVMQDLISGRKRLPGFSGKWAESTIEQIADCLDNLRVPLNSTQREKMVGLYPYCGANGVLDYVDDYCLDDDVVLIAEDGGYFDEYESRPIAYRMSGKIWVNNHAHVLKAKQNFDNDYLFFSLVHKDILPFLASGTRAKLNKSEMNKIAVRHPQEKGEQSAIAALLNDIETELAALAARLDLAHQISVRGQRLTVESDFDSRLPFGGSLGRTDWCNG